MEKEKDRDNKTFVYAIKNGSRLMSNFGLSQIFLLTPERRTGTAAIRNAPVRPLASYESLMVWDRVPLPKLFSV